MAPKKRKPGPQPVYKMKVSTPGSYSMDQIRKLSTIFPFVLSSQLVFIEYKFMF